LCDFCHEKSKKVQKICEKRGMNGQNWGMGGAEMGGLFSGKNYFYSRK
jgi:hypothetical protein